MAAAAESREHSTDGKKKSSQWENVFLLFPVRFPGKLLVFIRRTVSRLNDNDFFNIIMLRENIDLSVFCADDVEKRKENFNYSKQYWKK